MADARRRVMRRARVLPDNHHDEASHGDDAERQRGGGEATAVRHHVIGAAGHGGGGEGVGPSEQRRLHFHARTGTHQDAGSRRQRLTVGPHVIGAEGTLEAGRQ